MMCAHMRPRYQVSVYRIIGPLVVYLTSLKFEITVNFSGFLCQFIQGH